MSNIPTDAPDLIKVVRDVWERIFNKPKILDDTQEGRDWAKSNQCKSQMDGAKKFSIEKEMSSESHKDVEPSQS